MFLYEDYWSPFCTWWNPAYGYRATKLHDGMAGYIDRDIVWWSSNVLKGLRISNAFRSYRCIEKSLRDGGLRLSFYSPIFLSFSPNLLLFVAFGQINGMLLL